MNDIAVNAEELANLAAELNKIATLPGAGARAAVPEGVNIENEFCTIWPKAAPILTVIGKYIGYIPGVGTAAGLVINGLVDALNALSNSVCPKTPDAQ